MSLDDVSDMKQPVGLHISGVESPLDLFFVLLLETPSYRAVYMADIIVVYLCTRFYYYTTP